MVEDANINFYPQKTTMFVIEQFYADFLLLRTKIFGLNVMKLEVYFSFMKFEYLSLE
jgi:hypothetical protein